MKFNLITLLILSILLHWGCCDLLPREFTLQFLQNVLNATHEKENIAVAPHEAFKLYQELSKPPEPPQPYYWWHDETTTSSPIYEPESLITRNISSSMQSVLYSTTLRARWSFNFQSRDTRKLQFHQYGSGDHRVWADFLRKDDIFRLWEMPELNASVLELPLNLNEMKCLIILPNDDMNLEGVKDILVENTEMLMHLSNKSLPMKLVRVLLPKFQVKYEQDLKEFYDELSSDKFERYESIHQLTSLGASERGIGEFERTTVLFWNSYSYLRVAPQVVEINRPFLFMITSKEDIEFFGQVVKL